MSTGKTNTLRKTIRRQQSVLQHRENLTSIVKRSLDSIKEELYLVLGSTIADLGDHRDLALEMLVSSFTHDMQRRTDRFVHQNISTIWVEIDTDKNGTLDVTEMRALVKKILFQLKESLPTLVQSAMQPAMENLHAWIESDATGPFSMRHGSGGLRIAQDANVQGRVAAANDKMTNLFGLLFEVLVQNSDELAAEVFDEVDEDKDGKVTQAEFTEGFGEAMGQILDFSKIVSELLSSRSQRNAYGQPSLARSDSALGAPGCGGLVFGLGMVVVMAGMGYQVLAKRMAPRV